jgi:hypothetical protein
MLSRKRPKFSNSLNLNSLPVFLLIWLPAFGLLPESSITGDIMKIGVMIIIPITLYVWLSGLQPHPRPILEYMGIWITPLLITSVVYFVRTLEHLYYIFHLPLAQFIFISIVMTLLSISWLVPLFRSQMINLQELRQLGLLNRFKVLDEERERFNPLSYYPGVDGSSPDEMMKKAMNRWGWLMVLPVSGITFFLLRTTAGSINWLLLILCFIAYIIFASITVKTFAMLAKIRQWELELGKKFYVNQNRE